MRIGYVRVSTNDKTLALQREALTAAGCERVFADHGINVRGINRRGFDRALNALQADDTFVVWKLDRLDCSLSHLVRIIADFGQRGIGFESLSEKINTRRASGRLVPHIAAVFSKFERSLIAERTKAGIHAAKRRGQKLGRKPSLTPQQVEIARRLIESGESPRAVARSFKVGKSTLYRHLPVTCSVATETSL